jgi:hypothetical protein
MIFCNLVGGLGNMLFQIAAVKSLSIDNNTECYFPNLQTHLEYLNHDSLYNPKLNHSSEYNQIFKNLRTISVNKPIGFISVPFEYVELPKISEDTLIHGFFQSEKYFKHNRNEILNFLNFDFISYDSLEEKYPFLTKKTTSIHVRRGDYVKHPNHHPTQSIEYYKEAIEILKNETEIFIIFSDDITWCKENFDLENVFYVENEKDYIELVLMSLCKNNIISNSSFSWWGAWLNNNLTKKVIGPSKWFGPAINHNTGDILPENWIKI